MLVIIRRLGSGFPYPLPWSKVPENIYLALRLIYAMVYMPELKEKQYLLKSKGIGEPLKYYSLYRPDVPWFLQHTEGVSRQVAYIPPNVTCVGPMSISLGPAEEQDPELVAWLRKAPTVFINMGTAYSWMELQATPMVQAISRLLQDTNLQFLWKFRREGEGWEHLYNMTEAVYSDEFDTIAQTLFESERVKMESWFTVDPVSILETGQIVASVHHGGSGLFHEAIGYVPRSVSTTNAFNLKSLKADHRICSRAGVPQVVLPQWVDLYNYAQLVEDLGVGIWACRETSPYLEAECLYDALTKVASGDDDYSTAMRRKAEGIADTVRERPPGQHIAAKEIARLAAHGKARQAQT
jgi:hypothetical protein